MKGSRKVLLISAFCMFLCTPDDSQRCGEGYEYNGKSCFEMGDNSTEDSGGMHDASSGEDSDSSLDVDNLDDPDMSENIPKGLGTSCTEDGDQCDDLEASFCTANPMAPDGYCTITDCIPAEGKCPDGYRCCEMTVGNPKVVFCANLADFDTMSNIGLCSK